MSTRSAGTWGLRVTVLPSRADRPTVTRLPRRKPAGSGSGPGRARSVKPLTSGAQRQRARAHNRCRGNNAPGDWGRQFFGCGPAGQERHRGDHALRPLAHSNSDEGKVISILERWAKEQFSINPERYPNGGEYLDKLIFMLRQEVLRYRGPSPDILLGLADWLGITDKKYSNY